MSRILKRPMFRKGGLSEETGIMSGLDSPRRSYAGGGNIGGGSISGNLMGSRTGFGFPGVVGGYEIPYGKTGSQIASEAAKKITALDRLKKLKNLKNFNFNKIPGDEQLWKSIKKYGKKIGKLKLPGLAYKNPVSIGIPGALALKGSLMPITEEEKAYGMTGWRGAIEKGLAGSLPGGGMENIPLALRKALGVEKKVEEEPDENILLNTTGGEEKLTGDMESDLMKAYKEYAPIFEKELGVSPEDTKKQLYMQLAKFGTGLMAQPGGDLVGAVGKAAEKPLEGAGEVVKDVSTAKRQAKLLALQTAISENQPGNVGKALKDIAKAYKVSMAEAADIYAKWQTNNTTARAADVAAYRKFAEDKGVNPIRFPINIKKLLDDPDLADLVGKFNEKLPDDIEDAENKEYYITTQGDLVRVVDGEILTSKEPGFKDKPKEK